MTGSREVRVEVTQEDIALGSPSSALLCAVARGLSRADGKEWHAYRGRFLSADRTEQAVQSEDVAGWMQRYDSYRGHGCSPFSFTTTIRPVEPARAAQAS